MIFSEPMDPEGRSSGESLRNPEKGKFYSMGHKWDGYIDDVDLANENELIWEGEKAMFSPGKRPDNPYPAIPRLEVKASRKSPKNVKFPRDLDSAAGFLLVSDRLKRIFETVDPQGFVFVACDFVLPDGTEGPRHYLCDVTRTIDALDEEASTLRIIVSDEYLNGKLYSLAGFPKLSFKEDVVGSAHIFRTPYIGEIFCDRTLRDAVVKADEGRFRGIAFRDAADL